MRAVRVRLRIAYLLGSVTAIGLLPAPGFGQCTLAGATSWNVASGNWSVSGNWNPGSVPNSSGTNVCLANGTVGTPANTVLDLSVSVASLQVGANNTLNTNNGTNLAVNGPSILNAGVINFNGTGGGTYLQLAGGNVTLSGGGTLSLAGANTGVYNSPNTNQVLENVDNKIQGAANFGFGTSGYNMSLKNDAAGVIDANLNGQILLMNLGGGITNAGAMEATGGGQLQILGTVNNAGGTLTTDSNPGSAVLLAGGSTIQGGTFNGNIQTLGATTLDASSNTINNQATFTIVNGTQATVLGTINNTGNILLAGTGGGTYLAVGGAANSTTTLTGGGTVTLQGNSNTGFYNLPNANQTLENVNNAIQGVGQIGFGASGYNFALKNDTAGIINANVNGGTLYLNPGGGTVNTGLLEATNGGVLDIRTTVNNLGGTISTDATSSVNLTATTIQGGTVSGNLNIVGTATLDGDTQGTLNHTGTVTVGNGNQLDVQGNINNTGSIVLAGSGGGTYLTLSGAAGSTTTLTGGGTVTLQGGTNTGFYNSPNANQILENVNNTIQGVGQIGFGPSGYNFVLKNDGAGIINANVNGGTLLLNPGGGIVNTGLIEATGGGTLQLSTTVNNSDGLITTDGASRVNLNAAIIQGGTLNGNIQIIGASLLDGSTHGALAHESTGTVTVVNGVQLSVQGTIDNKGEILMAGAGGGTYLNIANDTRLTGGGNLTLQGGSNTLIYNQVNAHQVLENVDNTIRGVGQIGDAAVGYNMTLRNDVGGTIYANTAGLTLTVDAPLTNDGTLKVASGSTLHVEAALTNFAGNTLTGGTYDVSGTLKVDALGTTGGEITGNAANITLNGSGAGIFDASNKNALSDFQDNLAAGSFSVTGGQLFVTNGVSHNLFTNDGNIFADASSSFTTGGDYTQTGGGTQIDGSLSALGGHVDINGGTLSGTGDIFGDVTIGADGMLSPGDSPGTIHIFGNYTQAGTLNEEIGGSAAGQYDATLITGSAAIGGILNVSLVDGFFPADGRSYSYIILDALGGVFGRFSTVDFLDQPFGDTYSLDYSNPDEVVLDINGSVGGSAAPEPAYFLPLGAIIAALAGIAGRKRRVRVL